MSDVRLIATAPKERDASREAIEAAYKRLARQRHPDAGGSDALMAELNAARAKAIEERLG
jgi:curved DNA-binding protein CbpA